MKNLILAISSLIIISGNAAQASQIRIPIVNHNVKYVSVESAHLNGTYLVLAGTLPNVCFLNPVVKVESIDHNEGVIRIGTVATSSSDICIEMLGPQYSVEINLAELDLDSSKSYRFEIINLVDQPQIELTVQN